MTKLYIGDGVYAEEWENGGVRLTTEDGYKITNVIILEPEVISGLQMFLKRMEAENDDNTCKECGARFGSHMVTCSKRGI